MTDGSPTDAPPASAPAETAQTTPDPTDREVAQAVSAEPTAEEVEAIWKNRVAGKDRAHAQETATLRSQNADLTSRIQALEREQEARNMDNLSEAEQWKAKAEAAERELANERATNVVQTRTLKYGAAAEALDAQTLASMDEAKLAALNTRLGGGAPLPPEEGTPPAPEQSTESTPPVLPDQAPRRSPNPTSGPRDKEVGELESDLERFAPGWMAGSDG